MLSQYNALKESTTSNLEMDNDVPVMDIVAPGLDIDVVNK
jgi:hypothetical protein